MLDDQARARDVQRILGQAHDAEIRKYWRALNLQRDELDAAVSQWAGIDLGERIAAALDGPSTRESESVAVAGLATPPRSLAEHLPAAWDGVSRPDSRPTSPEPTRPGSQGAQSREESPQRPVAVPWVSLAIAASVMFLTILVLDTRVAVLESGGSLESAAEVRPAEVRPAESGFGAVPLPVDIAQVAERSVEVDDARYEERLQALLMRHAEKAAVGSGSGMVPLARLTSFQASRE